MQKSLSCEWRKCRVTFPCPTFVPMAVVGCHAGRMVHLVKPWLVGGFACGGAGSLIVPVPERQSLSHILLECVACTVFYAQADRPCPRGLFKLIVGLVVWYTHHKFD